MKNKKWLNYTLGILLTLIVLTAVAGAGIRAGIMLNAPFERHMRTARPPMTQNDGRFMQGAVNPQVPLENPNPQGMRGDFQGNGMPQNFQRQMFDNDRGFDRRGGGFSFFSPIFGLIRLAVLGLLVWIGYKFVKKSGWRLSLTKTSPAPTPAPSTSETPNVEVKEKKAAE